MLFGWFGTVIGESEARLYNTKVDVSFRWSMSWFIFSEVMFFAAFFGALFYVRNLSVPDLGSLALEARCGPITRRGWPTVGPYIKEQFTPMGAIGIPLLNTIILLTSGFTLTVAHHALKAGHRGALKLWLFATIALGFTFLGFQAYEYIHAYSALNLKLSTGVYGSTFFMLTGFHGAHVTIGAIMLSVMLARVDQGPLRRRAPLRVRGGGVVLALRRRRLAAAVRARLLALTDARRTRAGKPTAARANRCGRFRGCDAARDGVQRRPGRRDPAELVRDDQERDERGGQRHADRQRLDHARALAAVVIEVIERREQARDDRHQARDDDDLHAARSIRRV